MCKLSKGKKYDQEEKKRTDSEKVARETKKKPFWLYRNRIFDHNMMKPLVTQQLMPVCYYRDTAINDGEDRKRLKCPRNIQEFCSLGTDRTTQLNFSMKLSVIPKLIVAYMTKTFQFTLFYIDPQKTTHFMVKHSVTC